MIKNNSNPATNTPARIISFPRGVIKILISVPPGYFARSKLIIIFPLFSRYFLARYSLPSPFDRDNSFRKSRGIDLFRACFGAA